MKKRLLVYFFLTILVQVRPVKILFSRVFLSTVYVPVLSGYSRIKSLTAAEKEIEEMRKKLTQCITEKGRITGAISDATPADSVMIVTLVSYEPFGFPGILTYYPAVGKRGDILLWKGVMAGRVISIEQGAGQAATLYGSMFRIGAMIGEYNGILEGGIPPVVKYIPVEYPIKEGDTVYTSGIGESKIRGIPIGIVKKVGKDRVFPYFHRIEVKPFFDVHRAYKLVLVKNG